MRTISSIAVAVIITALALSQQQKYKEAQALPQERAVDTYSVYEAALPKPIWGHAYRGTKYYIVDRAIKPNSGWHPEQCMHPPDELQGKVREMLEDMNAQADAYKLETWLNLSQPYQLVSYDPAERRDSEGNALPTGAEIIQLGVVSFSKDRSLASLVVWSGIHRPPDYKGLRLGGGSHWRVFKRSKDGWEEQMWSQCGAIS